MNAVSNQRPIIEAPGVNGVNTAPHKAKPNNTQETRVADPKLHTDNNTNKPIKNTYKVSTKWSLRTEAEIPQEIQDLCLENTNSRRQGFLAARLLFNRGISDPELIKNFYLNMDEAKPSHAFEIPDMDKAFERIQKAISANEKIIIYGDYDVDGTTSVALLKRAFEMLGVKVDYYIPNRHEEGYGLNKEAIQKIKHELGADLMITCDCGISNSEEVDFANKLGLDVIITDHHSIPENKPNSIANCNPKTLAENHPLAHLPGVGVAYKLAEVLLEENIKNDAKRKELQQSLLDLVALGIVADLAQLKGENRLLCEEGLKVLSKTKKHGLRELLIASGSNPKANTDRIGFGIGPRINAAGRLSDAKKAVELMTTEDDYTAKELCENLNQENISRREICEQITEEAINQVLNTIDLRNDKVIVVGSDDWHHGVIGIAASRLVEKFHLPVFIVSLSGEKSRGSVRGINNSNLDIFKEMQTLQNQHNIFSKFGGHPMAAGFSIKKENFHRLRELIKHHFRKKFKDEDFTKVINIDSSIHLSEVNEEFIRDIEKLAPYGIGNPKPVFATGPLKVTKITLLGKNLEDHEIKHLKLQLEDGQGNTVEAVLWNKAQDFLQDINMNPNLKNNLSIAFTPQINEFRGRRSIQLDIKDYKETEQVDEKILARVKQVEARFKK